MSTDYLYTDGIKIFLNKESINSIEKKLKYGCYHEGWGEGAIADYVVRSGPEGSINLIFNTWGGDITTKQLKSQKYQRLAWVMMNHLVNKNIATINKKLLCTRQIS
jgi:hypothetical protein